MEHVQTMSNRYQTLPRNCVGLTMYQPFPPPKTHKVRYLPFQQINGRKHAERRETKREKGTRTEMRLGRERF